MWSFCIAIRLQSACEAVEQPLIDQRLFLVDEGQSRALLELLDRPAQDNAGLQDLFSRPDPWAS